MPVTRRCSRTRSAASRFRSESVLWSLRSYSARYPTPRRELQRPGAGQGLGADGRTRRSDATGLGRAPSSRALDSGRSPPWVSSTEGPLAQLAEQETFNLRVRGSSPRRPTKNHKPLTSRYSQVRGYFHAYVHAGLEHLECCGIRCGVATLGTRWATYPC